MKTIHRFGKAELTQDFFIVSEYEGKPTYSLNNYRIYWKLIKTITFVEAEENKDVTYDDIRNLPNVLGWVTIESTMFKLEDYEKLREGLFNHFRRVEDEVIERKTYAKITHPPPTLHVEDFV